MAERKPLKIISDIGPSGARTPMPPKKPPANRPALDGESIKVTVAKPAQSVKPSADSSATPVTVQVGKSQFQQKASNESKVDDIPEDIIPKAGELTLEEDDSVSPASAPSVPVSSEEVKSEEAKPIDETQVQPGHQQETDPPVEKAPSTNFASLAKSASAEMEAEEKDDTRPLHGFIYSPPKQPPTDAAGVQPSSSAARSAMQSPKVYDTSVLHPPLSGAATSSLAKVTSHIPKNRHIKAIIITVIVLAAVITAGLYVYSLGII